MSQDCRQTGAILHLVPRFVAALILTMFPALHSARAQTQVVPAARWWSVTVERTLADAGTNRAEIVKALNDAPESQREGLQFLVEHMPARDLRTHAAAYLIENLQLAYEAFGQAPWRDQVPKQIFFNEILPYASVNESREAWRRKLYDLAAPMVADCQTPAEAAHRLNQTIFKLLNVRYSTQRRRADLGPLETMESGLATCTGLSL